MITTDNINTARVFRDHRSLVEMISYHRELGEISGYAIEKNPTKGVGGFVAGVKIEGRGWSYLALDRQLVEYTDERGARASWGCTDPLHAARIVAKFSADGCTRFSVRPQTRADILAQLSRMGVTA